ncbi:ABC transporter substrate-binding protein [Cyclobacterium sp.]|uniref:ABC transporter substrate-binding protein n=1 Tax=Cyclobacterium sp. TaxID=1966343 RepID=UPI001996C158|nr:ABC transporter substrate-binding protein [Cyclobacterium sp.]MBD3627984.1 amino acid ABC transporter substrate-binding protein [Cyclobacterium sp.]
MKIALSIIFLFISLGGLFAQEEIANYKQAKVFIEEGEHVEAMELLRPYLDEEKYGALSGFARYHFARAAYGNRQFELAKNTCLMLLEQDNWSGEDEARYLLALSHFQLSAPSEALKHIAAISSENIKNEAYKATFEFLKVSSSSVLSVQYGQYPDNKGLVMALKTILESQGSLSSTERNLYEEIRRRAFEIVDSGEDANKDKVLDIAVVLPFNYEGGSGTASLGENNFVLQLYKGIQLALKQAKDDGVDLNFQVFDTERNAEKVRAILGDPFLKKADVILGPIYPEETALVAEFANLYQIPQINPLSNMDENIKSSNYSYLFRPSVQSISQRVIDYCRRFEGRRIALAYSGASRDEQLANLFTEMARRSGLQIVQSQKVNTPDMRDFFESLGLGKDEEPKVDMMVIFSDDPNVASPVFAMVESLGPGIPVVVMESWLYFNFANYEMMETQNFHFVGNNTVDFNDEILNNFRERFMDTYKTYPSSFVYIGYELADFVCQMINGREGFDFRENLDRSGYQEGKLTFGFDFTGQRSNDYVPILRLEEGVLTIEEE